jgi:glycine C-acetyltransferase
MFETMKPALEAELQRIRDAGLWKSERVLASPQGPEVTLADGRRVLVFCANNYLGLSSHPSVIGAAHRALDTHGFGLSSVRFICGTQDLHLALERRIAEFVGAEDAILYAACFDANGGVFEPLLGDADAIVSDELNHASIIDGIRLCKAKRWRYRHNDLADLERCLAEADAAGCPQKLVVTDGVFSMDGTVADLKGIVERAERHQALVMVDDCHATGFVGPTGRGTPELHGVRGRVDIVTGTLGKALGGALGGFTAARREIVAILRQRSRPYLFSNSLPPAVVAAGIAVFDLLSGTSELRDRLEANTRRFRAGIAAAGFEVRPGDHPIVPIMLYDERLAHDLAARLLEKGVYVIGFSYPVVARGQARIRVQLSAAHTFEQIDRAVSAFAEAGRELGALRAGATR